MNGHLVGQSAKAAVFVQVPCDDVLYGRADEEVLLAQPQLAARGCAVVRVQHPGDVFVLVFYASGAGVVASVECVQIDIRRGHGLPEPQRADLLRAMAGNHHVVGLGGNFAGRTPNGPRADVLYPAAKAHGVGESSARELPRRAVGQPRIGKFHLRAIANLLREHAVLITNAVAKRRQTECGHGVEKAGCQAPQATIAECCVGFECAQVF